MTLTELQVFMKKQELDLQLRTEKEKEEGENRWHLSSTFYYDRCGCISSTRSKYDSLENRVTFYSPVLSFLLPLLLMLLQPPSQRSC